MVKGILVNRKSDDSLKAQFKMEHADLVAEMQTVENLPTQERLQLARLRRTQQLKVARQKEKEWMKLQRAKGYAGFPPNGSTANTTHHFRSGSYGGGSGGRHISFENSVVLLEAASRNDMQEVAELLKRGITPDAANEDGLTALHQCCIDNNVEMLKLLLEFGANVDAQDSDKWTPLHAAATCGHLDLVRILIDRGANLLAVNTDGNMPYDLCDDENTLDFIEAEMSKRGVTQELIDETRSSTEQQMLRDLTEIARNGGDFEEPDYQGATPLHIAAANGYVNVVEFLLEMHVNVDALDKDLWSPVHAAACWGHMEVLEMLAQCGADLNVKNKDDETPSDICEDPEIRERIEQLKTEQETKRLAEAQRRRVRRSQSNNTRAQSVRRTSLRDKTLTTKKDAVEEARLRLQAQEVFTTGAATNGADASTSADPAAAASSSAGSLVKRSSNGNNNNHTASNNNNNNTNTNYNNTPNGGGSNNNHIHNNGATTKSSFHQANLALSHSMSADAVDTSTATYSASRRPPDGRENDDAYKMAGDQPPHQLHHQHHQQQQHQRSTSATAVIVTDRSTMSAAGGSGGGNVAADALRIQSSKEAANGKINVQVTVLVDTTSTHHHHHAQQQQQQQQQQQPPPHHYHMPHQPQSSSHLPTPTPPPPHQHQLPPMNHMQHDTPQQSAAATTAAYAGATLANLKKQRSLSRSSILNYENGSVLGAATTTTTTMASGGGHHLHPGASTAAVANNNNNHMQHQLAGDMGGSLGVVSTQPLNNNMHTNPLMALDLAGAGMLDCSSPAGGVNKFSGITGDVVSDSTSSKKCCIVM